MAVDAAGGRAGEFSTAVAAGAVFWRGSEVAVGVTLSTFCGGVRTGQGKAGLVVIEGDFVPTVCTVAAGAVRAKSAIMLVFRFMAAVAVFGCAGEIAAGVALGALRADMRAAEGKIGLVVIKGDITPAVGRVAASTVCTKLPVVFIVCFMAAGTILGGVRKAAVGMALLALHFAVRPAQCEFCAVVIKDDLLPVFRGVALGAVGPKLRFVGIIVLMAAGAVLRGAFVDPVGMAAFTFHIAVFANQRED